MVTFSQKGDFKKLNSFFQKMLEVCDLGFLDKYGKMGVQALAEATPKNSGLAAESWYYEIERNKRGVILRWCNKDIEGGYNVVLLIQYGHGTKNGGYVEGRDFINPALKPIFDQILKEVLKEVS